MPPCKNDPKRKYKGDEPSPKGLGWCAHGEKDGKVRKGLDGNKWIVKKVSSGSLRWVKQLDSKPVGVYAKMSTKNSIVTNQLDKLLVKKTITEKDEQYILQQFIDNSKLRKRYTPIFLKRIATLKPLLKKKIDIHDKLAICNQHTGDKCTIISMDKMKYDVYITKYVRNVASMLVIKNPSCDINNLTFSTMKKKMTSIGIMIIGNQSDIKLEDKSVMPNLIYDKNNKNIYDIDLPGRQINQDLSIYIGKHNSKIQAILIPLLNFHYL
jgi:hypothetical protein